MEWKAWALVLGLSMLVLAVIGLIVHSDLRLVGADVLGALAALIVVMMMNRRAASVGIPILSAVALLVMAVLAATSHGSPVLVALTLAFAFAFAFLSWTRLSRMRSAATANPPPRTA